MYICETGNILAYGGLAAPLYPMSRNQASNQANNLTEWAGNDFFIRRLKSII